MSNKQTSTLAYHNDQVVKERYIERMKSHISHDELMAGSGWDGKNGCAVGCTFHNYDHSRGPIEIGVPTDLIWLEDVIFEGLAASRCDYRKFPLAFLQAIPVGADLSLVVPQFVLWLLTGETSPMHEAAKHESVCVAISNVAALYTEWVNTGVRPKQSLWRAAERYAVNVYEKLFHVPTSALDRAAWGLSVAIDASAPKGLVVMNFALDVPAAADAKGNAWGAMRDKLLLLLSMAPGAE